MGKDVASKGEEVPACKGRRQGAAQRVVARQGKVVPLSSATSTARVESDHVVPERELAAEMAAEGVLQCRGGDAIPGSVTVVSHAEDLR